MADPRSPTGDPLPSSQLPPSAASLTEGTANLNISERDNAGPEEDNATTERTSLGTSAPSGVEQRAPPGPDPMIVKQVGEVLASEVGVPTLLARLKESIASTKEFALFLKKRSQLEDDHCQSLKKLCRSSQDNAHKSEHRQGTFSFAYDEMMRIHDRMAENGIQFASSLLQMHEDLIEHANAAERQRKTLKTNGLAAEQKVVDLETAMRKSKTKYDSLAEDYDRARTGETRQGGKVFGLKGPKSAAQHEEDLLRKVQGADQNYAGHVHTLQTEKSQLESSTRPEMIKALEDLIKETDSGLALQMQKFASFNEKLLLANGLIVSPTQGTDGSAYRSMRMAIASINNEKDFNDYVVTHRGEVQPKVEIKYERNPVLNPQGSSIAGYNQRPPSMGGPPQSFGQIPGGPDSRGNQSPAGPFPNQPSFTMGARTDSNNYSPSSPQGPPGGPQGPPGGLSGGPPGGPQGGPQGIPQGGPMGGPQGGPQGGPLGSSPFPQQQHNRNFSQGFKPNQGGPPGGPHGGPPGGPHSGPPGGPHGGPPGGPPGHMQGPPPPQYGRNPGPGQPFNGGQPQGPPQLGNLGFQQHPPRQPHQGPGGPGPDPRSVSGPMPPMGGPKGGPPPGHGAPAAAPTKPMFGVPLSALYERDGQAVPMVVQQCMQAVNLFGLALEGIYRQSGSMNHIQKLKHMFDMDSESPELDFRNPENFYHDVNSVTGLLKLFFRDLPDPLLTHEHHSDFIKAAKEENDTVRRDSLHAIINALPDPNYATLRAIALHLHRVMDNAPTNRMNSHNLSVIFGPTLMGTDPGTAIADAGWQIKVVDTILQNCYQIFDED